MNKWIVTLLVLVVNGSLHAQPAKPVVLLNQLDTIYVGQRYFFYFNDIVFDSTIIARSEPLYVSADASFYSKMNLPKGSPLKLNGSTLFVSNQPDGDRQQDYGPFTFCLLKLNDYGYDTIFKKTFTLLTIPYDHLEDTKNISFNAKHIILKWGSIQLTDVLSRVWVTKKELLKNLGKPITLTDEKFPSRRLQFMDIVSVTFADMQEKTEISDRNRNDKNVRARLRTHLKNKATGNANIQLTVEAVDLESGVIFSFIQRMLWVK